MIWTAAILFVALPQDPGPAPVQPQEHDVIVLKTGGRVEGRIVLETADYIELRMGRATTLGFERSRIESIEHGAGTVHQAKSRSLLADRDQWFVLHDAEGRVVGRLHSTVQRDDNDRLRVGEEWEFRNRGTTTDITRLDVVTSDLKPVRTFYRERKQRIRDARVLKERVVTGKVEGARFVVDKKTLRTHESSTYRLDPELPFQMSLLEAMRQNIDLAMSEQQTLYDSRTEQFEHREFSSRQRKVAWRKGIESVREIRDGIGGRRNAEWLDAACKTLRREVNGRSLVAVPVGPNMTERYLMSTEPVFPAFVVVDPGSRFALWLPNPSWKPEPVEAGEGISAREAVSGATATLMLIDQLDAGVGLDTAADTVARWLEVVTHGIEISSRERVRVRGREAISMAATYYGPLDGVRQKFRCEVYVFRVEDSYLALCLNASKSAFEDLRSDFAEMLESVDLYPLSADSGASMPGR